MARIQFQRQWRLADDKGKTVADGFTSVANAEKWAADNSVSVEPYKARKTKS